MNYVFATVLLSPFVIVLVLIALVARKENK